jgi:hypothetical protein
MLYFYGISRKFVMGSINNLHCSNALYIPNLWLDDRRHNIRELLTPGALSHIKRHNRLLLSDLEHIDSIDFADLAVGYDIGLHIPNHRPRKWQEG